jgi:hypothetical protein
MDISTIGFSGIAFALQAYGFTLIQEDFTKGIILVGAAIVIIGIAAFLNKKGIPVGGKKK